jgi:hypothetical protein
MKKDKGRYRSFLFYTHAGLLVGLYIALVYSDGTRLRPGSELGLRIQAVPGRRHLRLRGEPASHLHGDPHLVPGGFTAHDSIIRSLFVILKSSQISLLLARPHIIIMHTPFGLDIITSDTYELQPST